MISTPRKDGILVFVPALNDADGLTNLVSEIQAQSPRVRVLVIDDGSAPPIDAASFPPDVLLVRLPNNMGLGVCTHVAFDHALRHGYNTVVRLDADGQHPVDRIADLVVPLDAGTADVIVGGRSNRNSGRGLRATLSTMMKVYLSLISRLITKGKTPRDVNTGFIAFSSAAVSVLNRFKLERYPEPQIFILASRGGLCIHEIAIEQGARRSGTSSIRLSQALQIFYRFNVFVLGEILLGRGR